MTIVAAGGGSGGHVTPVLAVLRELKRHDPNLKAHFITDRKFGSQASSIMAKAPLEVGVKRIYAGKFRIYHGIKLWRQLLDIPTVLRNIRDVFLVGIGLLQSLLLLRKLKPDVVFTKGGFVCLPVGVAARILGIPLVIHDSDSSPGLTNRLLARSAVVIGTGAPTENYPYPEGRTHYVGIPVDELYHPASGKEQQACKSELGMPDTKKPLLVVTGGGLGARDLNHVVVSIAPQLLENMAIVHITGEINYQEVLSQAPEHVNYIIKPFLPQGLATAFKAADIVVTRAGATTMSELAAVAKPVIIVPGAWLARGHQLKNAAMYEEAHAAVVLQEDELILNPLKLKQTIIGLCKDTKQRTMMSKALHRFAKPTAALDMAALIAEAAYAYKQQKNKK